MKPEQEAPSDNPTDSESLQVGLRDLEDAVKRGDDAAILDYFRKRRLTDDERTRVQALIDQLGDNAFLVRQRATDALVKFGSRAAGMLRRASRTPDAEVSERAREVLRRVGRKPSKGLMDAVLKRLERSETGNCASVLLDYLPDAESDAEAEEIVSALPSLDCFQEGKILIRVDGAMAPSVARALEAAVTDPAPEKRAAARIILIQNERSMHVRSPALLQDRDPWVRYRVARAWVNRGDAEALPVLIDLLPGLESREAYEVLDILYQAAADEGPAVGLGIGESGRIRCRDAWRQWWSSRNEKMKTGLIREPLLSTAAGPTILVQLVPQFNLNRGVIRELDAQGKLQREIESLGYPVWAVGVQDGHILIVEYRSGRISERGKDGEEVWGVNVDHPLFAQRLPDGSTFIVSRDALWLAERKGSLRVIKSWPERLVATARRCLDGQTLVFTVDGTCIFLDAEGKELRRFETGCKPVLAPGIDVTANKRVIIPDHAGQRILEFSPDGEILWQTPALALQAQTLPGIKPFQQFMPISPACVQRLPDGNTLMVSTTSREVNEIDRLGQVVWRLQGEGSRDGWRPVAATRR
jgi:HEAT repeat protein